MMQYLFRIMCLVLATLALNASAAGTVQPVRACADLAGTDLADIGGAGSRVTRAAQSGAFCTVEGTLAPAIGFRVQLPLAAWTQRYLQVGCGGLCGRIPAEAGAADGCRPLADNGFVIGATDMGHQGGGEFGRDPQQRVDFAHRGVHLTAVAAKRLIRAFYGTPEKYAYFTGCSDGGREALMEAQRYPDDFDGIIAGAAALNFQVQNSMYHGWQARANTGPDGKAVLLASRLPILHAAVLAACDALDGQTDGLLANPRACRFDPATAQCPQEGPATACLTPAEVDAARRLYDGPRDPKTGTRLTAGGPQYGSELGWAGVFVPRGADEPVFSGRIALEALRDVLYPAPLPASYGLAELRFDEESFAALRALHPLYDATNPDLAAFAGAGGKLMLYHGWSDPHISPMNTIAYHQAVEKTLGAARTAQFERLYLLPGMYHCGGGEGPSAIDLLTPMMEWVERGVAPDAIVARAPDPRKRPSGFGQPTGNGPPKGNGPPPGAMPGEAQPARAVGARPVYPYPYSAQYTGKGDPLEAASYRRGPAQPVEVPAWAGSDFFAPYPPK